MRCSKNPVDAREKNIQQRAKSLSLAGALVRGTQYQHMFVFMQTVHVEIKEGLTAYVKFLLVDLRHVIKIVKKHYKRKLNDFREVFCRCIRYWLVKI